MKLDFKKIQELASQVPDIISKSQQVVGAVQTVVETFRIKDTTQKAALLAESKTESADKEEECALQEDEVMDSEYKESESLELAIAGVGYLKVPGDVTAMIGEMARQANETIRFCEEQKTLRTEIRANATVEITKINAMADMVRDYLKRSFDERADCLIIIFRCLTRPWKMVTTRWWLRLFNLSTHLLHQAHSRICLTLEKFQPCSRKAVNGIYNTNTYQYAYSSKTDTT